MESLPFPDNKFDVVFACHSFEHTERPTATLREINRVLKKGGIMVLVTPNYCRHHVLGSDFDHINVLTEWQLQRLLLYVGGWQSSNVRTYDHAEERALIEQDNYVVTWAVKE